MKLGAAISESSREFQLQTLESSEFQVRNGRRDSIVIGEAVLFCEDIAAMNEENDAGSIVLMVIVAVMIGMTVALGGIWWLCWLSKLMILQQEFSSCRWRLAPFW